MSDQSSIINSLRESLLAKLQLVTREEFDIQSKVLARTRAKLETLEQRVTALEAERRDARHRP